VTDGLGRSAAARRPIQDLRFVVVGAYVADCFIKVPRFPAWGEEYEARSIRTSPGGKALNQAVALARLGAQVAAVGVVGDDGLGRDVLAALAHEGIDVGYVELRAKVATTVCLCFVGDDGESTIVWHIDDDVAVTRDTVLAASSALQRADAVLITFELPVSTIREAIGAAHRCSARVIVQPAPLLADPAGATSLPWDQVDVLVPNEAEARALLGDSEVGRGVPADGLASALAARLGVGTVVVTLGAAGCVTHAAGVTQCHPAPKAKAVDTTGASDAFTATFAAHITTGAPEAEAIQAAQTAAVWTVGHPGGHKSMPSPG
jgi:ribokinase